MGARNPHVYDNPRDTNHDDGHGSKIAEKWQNTPHSEFGSERSEITRKWDAPTCRTQGHWEIINGQLTQTQSSALILPHTPDEISRAWADKLQKQADSSSTSVKNIVLANKTQLILQDTTTGTTDSYRRK